MEKFPAEFSDLIKKPPATLLADGNLSKGGEYVRWFPNLVKPVMAKKAMILLMQNMEPYLRTSTSPIPKELIRNLKYNFGETLPKTFRNDSVLLNSPYSSASVMAKKIGLLQMLGSESLRHFAEKCSGYTLDMKPGFQISRYKAGDFVGPHNDHHPEDLHLRDGYIDLHIAFSSSSALTSI